MATRHAGTFQVAASDSSGSEFSREDYRRGRRGAGSDGDSIPSYPGRRSRRAAKRGNLRDALLPGPRASPAAAAAAASGADAADPREAGLIGSSLHVAPDARADADARLATLGERISGFETRLAACEEKLEGAEVEDGVAAGLAAAASAAAQPPAAESDPLRTEPRFATVVADTSLRADPDWDSKVVRHGELKAGTVLHVMGEPEEVDGTLWAAVFDVDPMTGRGKLRFTPVADEGAPLLRFSALPPAKS